MIHSPALALSGMHKLDVTIAHTMQTLMSINLAKLGKDISSGHSGAGRPTGGNNRRHNTLVAAEVINDHIVPHETERV